MFTKSDRIGLYVVRWLGCVGALVAAMSGTLTQGQEQQQYKTLKIELPRDEIGKTKIEFDTARRNPAGFGAGEEFVKSFLTKYFFPLMSQNSPNNLAALAKLRKTLMTQYIPEASNAASREYFIEQTFFYSRGMARGNFHPAVRYNAVLMLGELDQQLAAGTNPPVPHPKATQELLELVEQTQINRIEVPESVKLGALLGLERHTRYGIDPALGDRLTKTMIAVMASPTPEDVESAVHDWTRSSAAMVLANQYAKTPTKEVQTALTNLIADKKVGLEDRCIAAGVVQRITYAAGADLDADATFTALAQLTLDVITDAAKLAREYQEKALDDPSLLERSEYGGRRGGYGRGGYGEEQDTGPRFERRELFSRLHNIRVGADSLKEGLGDENKGRIDALLGELAPVVQVMEDKGKTDVDVTREVIALESTLKALVESWGVPVAEAKKPVEGLAEN